MESETKKQIRIKLYTYAEKQESSFRTEEAKNALDGFANCRMNNNRIGSMLKGNKTHEYYPAIKKWIKKRI